MALSLLSSAAAALCLAAPPPSVESLAGFEDPEVTKALEVIAHDPAIADVQEAALDYFGVTQGDLTTYRATSRLRALLPSFSGTFSQDDSKSDRESTDRTAVGYDPTNPQIRDNSASNGRIYAASATWELGALVFDSSQLETYALVGIHEDIVKEVTRLYYTRQHNLLALAISPPKDARARAALIIRTREIDAMLNALTGGAWTRLRERAMEQ